MQNKTLDGRTGREKRMHGRRAAVDSSLAAKQGTPLTSGFLAPRTRSVSPFPKICLRAAGKIRM